MSLMRTSILLLATALLAACGFQLRGSYSLPFATLHITLAPTTELYATLKRTIEASSSTRVVADPNQAEAVLRVLEDRDEKAILSLNSSGRIREFQLTRSFSFKLTDSRNVEIVPASQITLRRELTYNDDQVLSKQSEEALIWREMQSDLAQQIMRRLTSVKPRASQ